MSTYRTKVDEQGFALVPDVLAESSSAELLDELEEFGRRLEGGLRSHGVRNLAALVPGVGRVAEDGEVADLVESILGAPGQLVRSTLFDKTPDANWKVTWHQDLTIAVQQRHEVEGFGPWSVKQGVTSVQPPATVLEHILTVRIHLDPCGLDNGPLRVIPGTHRLGRLSAERIDELVTSERAVTCTAEVGTALLMRPLLLHASSSATSPAHRRVIHLDFAALELPGGLEWSQLA